MSEEVVRLELREHAAFAERNTNKLLSLAALWRELTSGRVRIVDSFMWERCYVVLNEPPDEARSGLGERQQRILEALLCGQDNKNVAFDFDIKPSTASQAARQALQQLGVDSTPGRVCPLLPLAAQAGTRGHDRQGRTACFVYEGRTYNVVGADRPDDLLAPLLSPAQYAVVRGLLEGRPYVEIARRRGTSTRTVANQLASVFRRVGVSGRGSLLHHLITYGDRERRSA